MTNYLNCSCNTVQFQRLVSLANKVSHSVNCSHWLVSRGYSWVSKFRLFLMNWATPQTFHATAEVFPGIQAPLVGIGCIRVYFLMEIRVCVCECVSVSVYCLRQWIGRGIPLPTKSKAEIFMDILHYSRSKYVHTHTHKISIYHICSYLRCFQTLKQHSFSYLCDYLCRLFVCAWLKAA